MSLLCDAFPSIDTVCVNTGEVKISKKTLVTSFVNICTVLGFHHNGINFLAHVDVMEPDMESKVKKKLNKIESKYIKKIHIWKGSNCEDICPSFQIVKNIIKELNGDIIYHKDNNNIIKIQ